MDAPAPPARLRVVSWNIRAAIGPGDPFPPAWWRHVRRDRLERIGSMLRALDADVVTLQEVTIMTPDGEVHDQPTDLGRLTGLAVRYAATHTFPLVEPETGRTIGSALWGNAVLTRAPLRDGFATGLPRTADDDLIEPVGVDHPLAGVRYGDAEPGHREPRCVVGGTIDVGGVGVTVATTHLTYIGSDQRRRQADGVRAVVDETRGPLVLTGDVNAPIGAAELGPIRADLVDAFAAVGIDAGHAARASSGTAPIDQVLVRGLAVETCRVHVEAGDASDHWPVVVDLRLDPA